jgi:hypothetical protein
MRILFILTLTSLIRHFESVVLALADDGHTIAIATPGRPNDWPLPDAVVAHSRISRVVCPRVRQDDWKEAATDFRLLVDCGRYLDGPFFQAEKLRTRAFVMFARTITNDEKRHVVSRCPSCHARLVDGEVGKMTPALGRTGSTRMRELLRLIEEAIPSDPAYENFLASERPDVLLVSPLVGLGSEQTDWVKSAKALGIPVGFPVFSWDNLTTKGIIHVQPDQVFVWNEIQKREAIEYHGIPADRIIVTGAPRFDAFVDLAPTGREKFCARFGLDPGLPMLTYLCSSEFVAGREVEFVQQWIEEIRREPSLASCNVLIRPHPRSLRQWKGVDISQWPQVGLAMSGRLNADRLLYNTLYHSAAVVGLNTSAQIEAGILGKPVYTLLAPGFEPGQQRTLHFRYLLREEGGFVEVATDFDEHRRQLADAVAGRYDSERIRRFIESFIRPMGWNRPATPILADGIARMRSPSKFSIVRRWLPSSHRP